MQDQHQTPGEWPQERLDDDATGPWLHSDLKDVAYPYVYRLFDAIVETGNLR